MGYYPSICVGNGYPQISYDDSTNLPSNAIKFAYQDGSGWHTEIVELGGFNSGHSSLAFFGGYPRFSYYHGADSGGNLKYAWKDGSGWHTETVDYSLNSGVNSGLAIDSSGIPKIAYLDSSSRLKYAWKDSSGWHIEFVYDGPVSDCSLTLMGSGAPRISFHDGVTHNLRIAKK